MNTITKVPIQSNEPVIPVDHPDVITPNHVGVPFDQMLGTLNSIPTSLRPKTALELLRRAQEVMEERAREYDKPAGERSIGAVVTALNAIVGRKALTEAEGWLFMELLKNVRLFSAPGYHADSGLDGIAYSALMAEAKAKEAK